MVGSERSGESSKNAAETADNIAGSFNDVRARPMLQRTAYVARSSVCNANSRPENCATMALRRPPAAYGKGSGESSGPKERYVATKRWAQLHFMMC